MKTPPIQSKIFRFVMVAGFVLGALCCGHDLFANQDDDSTKSLNAPSYNNLRANFLDLPVAEKLTGPLYWTQEEGNTKAKDNEYVNIMIEGGNGHCTIESLLTNEKQ